MIETPPIPDPPAKEKTLQARLAEWPESAGYAFFISAMAFIAGFLGSVWTEDIKNSFPLNGKMDGLQPARGYQLARGYFLEPYRCMGISILAEREIQKQTPGRRYRPDCKVCRAGVRTNWCHHCGPAGG
jgi:hypothetical protein